jgi:hypothetical protein
LSSLFQGTPEIREHYLDSKKDVDRHLKSACEQFIQQQTRLFVEQLEEFMTKVQAWRALSFPSFFPSCERKESEAGSDCVLLGTFPITEAGVSSV